MILGHRDRQKTVIKVVFRSNESYRMILFRYVTSHLQETIQAEGKHFSQLKLMGNYNYTADSEAALQFFI